MKIVIRGWDEPNGMPATWTIELSVDAGEEAVVSHGSLERTQNVESNFRAEIEVRYGDVTRQAACHVVGSPGGMTYELLRLASCIARVVDRRDTSESVNLQRVGLHSQDQYTVGSAYFAEVLSTLCVVNGTAELAAEGLFTIEIYFGYNHDSPFERFRLFVDFETGEAFARSLANACDRFDDLPSTLPAP